MSSFNKLIQYFKDNDIELLAVLALVKILLEDIDDDNENL